jgi:magnesium and cobalt transporter
MTNSSLQHSKPPSRSWLARLLLLFSREPHTREELMGTLREAEQRHILSTEMLGMIERIMQVSEMQVRDVMVPKAQMVMIEKDSNLEELLSLVISSGHSRFPVVDQNHEEVVGILLAKDLLNYGEHPKARMFNINELLRPAVFTPQSKRLDILLREFRVNRNHIAMVLDEYGHMAGLVTIEDVLEQIVGEIEDEYDVGEDDSHIKKLNDGAYIIKAQTPIEEFNNYFHATFSDDEFDTIGGIVLKGFEHLPKRGESIKLQGFRFKVLHSDNRRVYLLEVRVLKKT